MSQEDGREFYLRPQIPDEWKSRGSGETMRFDNTTEFDFMPVMIGNRIFRNPVLITRAHQYGDPFGDHAGPFTDAEEAYRELSYDELKGGNILESIDAYRRSLHYATGLRKTVQRVQDHAVMRKPMPALDIDERFGELEELIMQNLVRQNISFQPAGYGNFVEDHREMERRRFQLHQLFYFGESMAYERLVAPQKYDPSVSREYMEMCERMNRYAEAASIAKRMGYTELQQKYEALYAANPPDNPKGIEYFNRISERNARDYYGF